MRRSMRPRSQPVGPAAATHADYLALKARGLSHTRASLTIARRSFHVLRELGPGRPRSGSDTRATRSRWHRCGTGAARASVTPSPSASSTPSSTRADPARLAAGRRVRVAAREAPARAALRCFDRACELALPADPVALARTQSGHVMFGRRGNGHRGLLAVVLMASVPGSLTRAYLHGSLMARARAGTVAPSVAQRSGGSRPSLADDHTMIRRGLRMETDAEEGLTIVAEAGDVERCARRATGNRTVAAPAALPFRVRSRRSGIRAKTR